MQIATAMLTETRHGNKTCLVILLTLSVVFTVSLKAQIITTIAGNGTYGYSGDGGPAIDAQLSDMYYCSPAIDQAGNIYIAQSADNTIRKIDQAGIITTIAGQKGVIGHEGDGGPAADALLYHPNSIVIDNAGNILFADANGSYIRKIDPAGIITTITGHSTGDCGVGDGGPLSSARFGAISSLTLDKNGNLYISDFGCNTIRKVNAAGIVTTIAGNNTYGFSGDGGPATSAQLDYPAKTAVDNAGNIYVADARNHRIRRISAGGIITTIAGIGSLGYSGDGGAATDAQLHYPGGVVLDKSDNLYLSDYNDVIRKVDVNGVISTYAGNGSYGYSGDGGPAILASMHFFEGKIAIDASDNIYFVNYQVGNVIRKITNCNIAHLTRHPSDAELCGSGNASFSVTSANATGYQWQWNAGAGWNDLADNAIYNGSTTANLAISGATVTMTDYTFRCAVTNGCGLIYSLPATLTVNASVTPSVTINTLSENNCEGESVSFSAVAVGGGSAPVFEWRKNGVAVQTGLGSYVDDQLVDGDIISCVLTSSNACITNNTAVSNSLTMKVAVNERPSLSIVVSENNVCSGQPVTFVATAVNGGTAPAYTWLHNGVNLFINSTTYIPGEVKNGDVIMCAMLSNLKCVTNPFTSSNLVTMAVRPPVPVSISVTASAKAVCRNTPVQFTASAVNEGTAPVFQWKKNGIAVGTNSREYIDDNLLQTDLIICTLTSNADCSANTQATSNAVSVTIHPDPNVTLDRGATLCAGSSKNLDAGNFTSYLWNTGSTARFITVENTGLYSVIVTDKNGCLGSDVTNITTVVPPPAGFLNKDTSLCAYADMVLTSPSTYKNYFWSTGSTASSITIKKSGEYWLSVTDEYGCVGNDTIFVSQGNCLAGFFMPTAFTPNNDGKNDVLKPSIHGNIMQYHFRIYNRWGQIVFETKDPGKGWKGDINTKTQNSDTFVWQCVYQIEGAPVTNTKGAVVLLR